MGQYPPETADPFAGLQSGSWSGVVHDGDTIEIPELVLTGTQTFAWMAQQLTITECELHAGDTNTGYYPSFDPSIGGDLSLSPTCSPAIFHPGDSPFIGTGQNNGVAMAAGNDIWSSGWDTTPGHFLALVQLGGLVTSPDPLSSLTLQLVVRAQILDFSS